MLSLCDFGFFKRTLMKNVNFINFKLKLQHKMGTTQQSEYFLRLLYGEE